MNDGGYLIPSYVTPHIEKCISFGINVNWSFESSLLRRQDIPLDAYDINYIPFVLLRFILGGFYKFLRARLDFSSLLRRMHLFFRFFLFFRGSHRFQQKRIDLSSIIPILREIPDNTLLKCDIEGSEYCILDSVLEYRSRLAILVFEFHDCIPNNSQLESFITAISSTHTVVHLHANNFESPSFDGRLNLIELTICRNDLINHISAPPLILPIPLLDTPTLPNRPDITLAKPHVR